MKRAQVGRSASVHIKSILTRRTRLHFLTHKTDKESENEATKSLLSYTTVISLKSFIPAIAGKRPSGVKHCRLQQFISLLFQLKIRNNLLSIRITEYDQLYLSI